ncbi:MULTISPECIES: spore protease YyaC [Sinobaca]|uniref:Putative sporulation protein YyaC n=1 Tax=Sinobaca qinghaiensis TaxID=342944 RepID=A0A419UU29_9BACL|nr:MULTISPECIES: spore protease YyaC [Sinobaca]RKD68095.1 putative sporulation protein YyaC [Sinobaca qinghaiensis]
MFRKQSRPGHPPASLYLDTASEQTPAILSNTLTDVLSTVPETSEIVIVCIGTDRSTGDSLGPLTGTLLTKHKLDNFQVYGTLASPVHAVNLEDVLADIQIRHTAPYIIAVDACLGRVKNVGSLHFEDGPVYPGAAMKKNLPPVGSVHITGIVNVGGMMEFFVLQNTRLHVVMQMAESLSESFVLADRRLQGKKLIEKAYQDRSFSITEKTVKHEA